MKLSFLICSCDYFLNFCLTLIKKKKIKKMRLKKPIDLRRYISIRGRIDFELNQYTGIPPCQFNATTKSSCK